MLGRRDGHSVAPVSTLPLRIVITNDGGIEAPVIPALYFPLRSRHGIAARQGGVRPCNPREKLG